VLFSIPSFQARYFQESKSHIQTCREEAATCFHCQMGKLAEGLLSGRYSIQKTDEDGKPRGQDGIAPSMFKQLVGKGHPDFSTMRQQDATEFLQHVLNMIEQV
jgi:ubiquitin carboxyl-terminal hydrolase 5/13